MSVYHSLVTGGAGFIGSNLVRHLLARGHRVTVVDDLSTGRFENIAQILADVHFVEGDIRDQQRMTQLFQGIDSVFHQAALPSVPRSIADPWASHDVNVNGTMSVLLAARDARVRRVVYAASSSAYGNTAVLPKVETMPSMPLSPYAITKHVGELYCHVFHRVFGLETVALRYFNVFGPRQDPNSHYAAVIPNFVSALLRGESPGVHGDGEQTRDFTFVENVVSANLGAALAPAGAVSGKVFNVGCGGRISLNELLRLMQLILGTNIAISYASQRAGDVRDSQADIRGATTAFGYAPAIQLEQGLRRTIDWLIQEKEQQESGLVADTTLLTREARAA
jgi:UDP-N-acetylglucosamine/UDP-N-acetyl-alpha-D-glucosaminouronate 4-epimerase